MKKLQYILLMSSLFFITVFVGQAASYDYPFADPIEATILSTPPADRAELPDTIRAKQHQSFDVFPDRKAPEVFWYNEKLRFAVAYQKKEAPVMFLIAGTGAGYDSAKMKMMQKAFFQAGFHVVSLSSPTHPNFIVSASHSGMPGDIQSDAADLYSVMEKMLAKGKKKHKVSDFYLAGYSLGGSQAAYVSKLDEERKVFNFKKVLMINPALNIYDSAIKLDKMLVDNVPGGMEHWNEFYQKLMKNIRETYAHGDFVDLAHGFFYKAYDKIVPTPEEGKALIGFSFRISLTNLLFTADVMTNSGFIVPKNLKLSSTDSLTEYGKVIGHLNGFSDYAKYLVYPKFKAVEPGLSLREFVDRSSLRSIEQYLRQSEKIGLITNVDDLILAKGDVEYFKEVFGSRAKVYPRGGHCGNMAYKDNVAYMVDFFKSE